MAVLLLLVIVMSAGAWYLGSQLASLDDVSTPPPEISGAVLEGDSDAVIDTSAAREQVERQSQLVGTPDITPVPDNSLTVLMMGVDADPGQPIDIQVRADVLAVVHIDPDAGTCRMLSIPRDTRVPLPGYGYSKANHALAIGGVPYQQLVVEQYLGVEVDHYGLIDFAGMTQLVDAVGGVAVENVDYPFETAGMQFPLGRLRLTGEEAVRYARYRGGPDGDYGRQKRQQQVARALLERGARLNVITAVPELLDAVRGHIRTDTNGRGLMDLAQKYRSSCTADSLETELLDGTVATDWDDLSEQELHFVHVEDAELQQKVAWLLGSSDAEGAATDVDLSPPTGVDPMAAIQPIGAWHLARRNGSTGGNQVLRSVRAPVVVRTRAARQLPDQSQ